MKSSPSSARPAVPIDSGLRFDAAPRSIIGDDEWRSIGRLLQISARELEIVQGIFDCQGEHQIALDLDISPHTVHSYVRRLYGKLEVSSHSELLVRVFAAWRFIVAGGG